MVKTSKLMEAIKRRKAFAWKLRPEVLRCGRIPEPLHGLAPRVVLGSKWWDKTRQASYKSTAFHCVACGVHKGNASYRQWLEGHELYSVDYLLGRMTYLETVPLCHLCHNYIHSGRLAALLEEGKITHVKYKAVIQHGDRVLEAAGLRLPEVYDGMAAEASEWRLIINGKEYKKCPDTN